MSLSPDVASSPAGAGASEPPKASRRRSSRRSSTVYHSVPFTDEEMVSDSSIFEEFVCSLNESLDGSEFTLRTDDVPDCNFSGVMTICLVALIFTLCIGLLGWIAINIFAFEVDKTNSVRRSTT